jgi:hypothetical protein
MIWKNETKEIVKKICIKHLSKQAQNVFWPLKELEIFKILRLFGELFWNSIGIF